MVQLLMDKGAVLGAREVGGRTALEHCLYNEDLATTRVVLGKRLSKERQDIRLDRAMNIAIAKAFNEVVRLMFREGCRIFTNDQKSGFLKYAKDCAEYMGDDKAQAMNEIITMLEDAITPGERGRSWSPNAYQQSRSSTDDNGKHDDPRWKHKVARYEKSAKKSDQRSRQYPSSQSLQGQHGEAYPSDCYNRNRGFDTLMVDGESKRPRSSFETTWEPNKHPRTY